MREFYRLISFVISVTGFFVVAAASYVRGETILGVVVRSVLAFAALWIAQSLLRPVAAMVANPRTQQEPGHFDVDE
jgi:hypothetical protein